MSASTVPAATTSTPDIIHKAASIGFGSETNTAAYERGRPSYDAKAIDALLTAALAQRKKALGLNGKETITVLDIGAGTGKSTRIIWERMQHYQTHVDTSIQFQLTAVEPVEGMRHRFTAVTPDIPIIAGSAAHMPLIADNSIDIIFACQAFHWFSTIPALTEFHRVLKTGAAIALIWNTRNRAIAWVNELETLIDSYYTPDVPRQQTGEFRRVFTLGVLPRQFSVLEEQHYENDVVQTGDLQLMLDRVMSISVIASLDGEERQRVEECVKEIVTQHPDHVGATQYSLPYKTEVYWTYKIA